MLITKLMLCDNTANSQEEKNQVTFNSFGLVSFEDNNHTKVSLLWSRVSILKLIYYMYVYLYGRINLCFMIFLVKDGDFKTASSYLDDPVSEM